MTRALRLTAVGTFTLGATLRLYHYFSGRSLWLDEAMLAQNLLARSPAGLLGALEANQSAPYGFLLLSKASVWILGPTEMALRLFPLLASLVALGLFLRLSARLMPVRALPIAWTLFAAAPPLIYFAAEFKPYSVDVLVVLVLTALALVGTLEDRRHTSAAAIGGVLVPWFSFAGLFALPIAGAMLAWRSRNWRRIGFVGAAWLLSTMAAYHFSISPTRTEMLVDYWAFAYPESYGFVGVLSWLVDALSYLPPPVLLVPPILIAAVAMIGAVRMVRCGRRVELLVIAAPVIVGFALAFAGLYPMVQRLALFALPALVWLFAVAFAWNRVSATLGLVVSAVAIVLTMMWLPPEREELRPVLKYVAAQAEPDDAIYAYWLSYPAMLFYAPRLGLEFQPGTKARGCPSCYLQEVDSLPDSRVWITYSHPEGDDMERIISHLDSTRIRLDSIGATGAGAVLYTTP